MTVTVASLIILLITIVLLLLFNCRSYMRGSWEWLVFLRQLMVYPSDWNTPVALPEQEDLFYLNPFRLVICPLFYHCNRLRILFFQFWKWVLNAKIFFMYHYLDIIWLCGRRRRRHRIFPYSRCSNSNNSKKQHVWNTSGEQHQRVTDPVCPLDSNWWSWGESHHFWLCNLCVEFFKALTAKKTKK